MPRSISIFYSYAHQDRELRDALEMHLSALKNDGIIETWSDREIRPGADWGNAIHENLERADIILLLVDAHFLNSGYIAGIELKRALERAQAGAAVVIPILLRPVDLGNLAYLQYLPSDGRPLTKWGNRDEAFADIAAGIRRAANALRGEKQAGVMAMPERRPPAAQERLVDAALTSRIAMGKPADLAVMVRLTSSPGLKAILEIEDEYSADPEDVRSKRFELEFPSDFRGRPQPVDVMLVVDSPDFEPPKQTKNLRVPPDKDSDVCTFLLTPLFAGELLVNLEVYLGRSQCASRMFRVVAEESDRVVRGRKLVSIPISTRSVPPPVPVPAPVQPHHQPEQPFPPPKKMRVSPKLLAVASVAVLVSANVVLYQRAQRRGTEPVAQVHPPAQPKTAVVPPDVEPISKQVSADPPGPSVQPPPKPPVHTKSQLPAKTLETIRDLKSVSGDLGIPSGLIATTPQELAALKALGERSYFEFKLESNGRPQTVGGALLLLKATDPSRNRFTLEIVIDGKLIQKAGKTIHEPLQFYAKGFSQPYELIVNTVDSQSVAGYLAVPAR